MPRLKFDLKTLPPAPDLEFEQQLWQCGLVRIAGVDEAGRGALAGPVCAAAVVLPPDPSLCLALEGVDDSKQLTAPERERLRAVILQTALAVGIGFASAAEIDAAGIVPATRLAIRRALLGLDPLPDHLLVDFLDLPEIPIPQTSLVKGDARCLSIAAASVLAKTSRDEEMDRLASEYPAYRWEHNKGYGTAVHLAALRTAGASPLHRVSFAPIRSNS